MLLCLLNIPNEYTCENLPENWLVFENLSNEKTQTNKSNPGCFAFKTIKDIGSIFTKFTLREKCPYLEFFWSVFSLNTGNAYRKKSEYGQFTQSLLSMLQKLITFSIRYKL